MNSELLGPPYELILNFTPKGLSREEIKAVFQPFGELYDDGLCVSTNPKKRSSLTILYTTPQGAMKAYHALNGTRQVDLDATRLVTLCYSKETRLKMTAMGLLEHCPTSRWVAPPRMPPGVVDLTKHKTQFPLSSAKTSSISNELTTSSKPLNKDSMLSKSKQAERALKLLKQHKNTLAETSFPPPVTKNAQTAPLKAISPHPSLCPTEPVNSANDTFLSSRDEVSTKMTLNNLSNNPLENVLDVPHTHETPTVASPSHRVKQIPSEFQPSCYPHVSHDSEDSSTKTRHKGSCHGHVAPMDVHEKDCSEVSDHSCALDNANQGTKVKTKDKTVVASLNSPSDPPQISQEHISSPLSLCEDDFNTSSSQLSTSLCHTQHKENHNTCSSSSQVMGALGNAEQREQSLSLEHLGKKQILPKSQDTAEEENQSGTDKTCRHPHETSGNAFLINSPNMIHHNSSKPAGTVSNKKEEKDCVMSLIRGDFHPSRIKDVRSNETKTLCLTVLPYQDACQQLFDTRQLVSLTSGSFRVAPHPVSYYFSLEPSIRDDCWINPAMTCALPLCFFSPPQQAHMHHSTQR